MSSVPSSAILLILAIVVTGSIIGFTFRTTSTQKEATLSANTKISKTTNAAQESEYTRFEEEKIPGSMVISIAEQYKNNTDEVKIETPNKIVKSAMYEGKIERDSTGKITKLIFATDFIGLRI